MSKTVKEKIKGAKLPERLYPLCLRGDLDVQWRELAKKAAEAKLSEASSLEGDGSAVLAAQLEALREEIVEESIELHLRGLTQRRWDELMAEFPARPGNKRDAKHGYNAYGFFRAAIRESVVEPEMDDEDWTDILGTDDTAGCITDGQWDDLTTVVAELNRQPASIPFSFAAWLKTNSSAPA